MLDFHSAEFFVIALATAEHDPFAGLPEALAGIPEGLPILDLGCGTGYGTIALAEAVPAAEVIAVEQDAAQRIALMTCLAERPDLRERVSVVAGDLFTARLPQRWGAVLAHHVVCQLDRAGRLRLIRLIADHLADDGVAVLDWHYDATEPSSSPERLVKTFTIGRHTYQRWTAMQPAGPEASRVTQTYRVFEGDILVREAANESVTPLIRGDELLADIAASGLTATRHGENLLVLGFGNGQERAR